MLVKIVFPGETTSRDYTDFVGEITISDNIDSLGAHLKFTAITHMFDQRMKKHVDIPIGSYVRVSDNDGHILFFGTVVTRSADMKGRWTYDAYDEGFYLNKSMISIQFNNIDAHTAIKQVLAKQNFKCGKVCDIPTKIRKIYHGDIVADVIRDILKQAEEALGTKYRLEIRDSGSVFIELYRDLEVPLVPILVNSVDYVNAGREALDVKFTESMEDLKTQVTVVSGSEKAFRIRHVAMNEVGVNQFGLINEVIKADGKNQSQMREIAYNRLVEASVLKSTHTFKLFGDRRVRSGRVLNFEPRKDGSLNLIGKYLVKSCVHTYSNNVYHTMELEVQALGLVEV